MSWLKRWTCFACESRPRWFFLPTSARACLKMTYRVGKHESSYIQTENTWYTTPKYQTWFRAILGRFSKTNKNPSETWTTHFHSNLGFLEFFFFAEPLSNSTVYPRPSCCMFQESDEISFESYARIEHVITGYWLHALRGSPLASLDVHLVWGDGSSVI